MTEAIKTIKQRSKNPKIWLGVDPENPMFDPVIKFYISIGFGHFEIVSESPFTKLRLDEMIGLTYDPRPGLNLDDEFHDVKEYHDHLTTGFGLTGDLPNEPEGLHLYEKVLNRDQAEKLYNFIDKQDWDDKAITNISRDVQHYGYIYKYKINRKRRVKHFQKLRELPPKC